MLTIYFFLHFTVKIWWRNDQYFIANFLLNLMVKEFEKSTNIWQSY